MIPRSDRFVMRYMRPLLMTMNIAIILLFVYLLSGCAAMLPKTPGEWAFQAANGMDMLQTINHGSDPCYVETNGFTNSILGDNPGTGETIAFFFAVSAIHRAISWELQEQDVPKWVQRTWEAVTFVPKAYTVYDNHQNGVRMWGDNKQIEGCNR